MESISKYWVAGPLAAALAAVPAGAQPTAAPPSGPQADSPGNPPPVARVQADAHPAEQAEGTGRSQLEEIVVTAQRRSENLQVVPISITAVTANALARSGVTGSDTLNMVVPSLNINRAGGKTIQPYVRGVGTAVASTGAESPVAIYVDGVYYADLQGSVFQFNNIERIEVLKGPQGTLFGRNATGGLINVITRDPSPTESLEASLSYGNYNTWEGTAYATGGNDKVAADVAVYFLNQGDGFGHHVVTGAKANWRDEFGIRSKLQFHLSPDDKLTLAADYYSSKGDYGITSAPFRGRKAVGGATTPANIYDRLYNFRPSVPVSDHKTVSLTYEHHFGWGMLHSVSAYRRDLTTYRIDQDTGPLAAADTTAPSDTRTLQQEIFVTGDHASLHWTAGIFLFDHVASYTGIQVRSALAATSNTDIYSRQHTFSYAGFGEVTYAITAATHVTAGLRYTVDDRDFAGHVDAAAGNPKPAGTVLLSSTGKQVTKDPTWRLGVDHRFTPDFMVYASYNRGFKSGAFNLTSIAAPPLRPERIDAYEVGFKSELFDRLLRLNGSAFRYDYSDIQLSRTVIGGNQLFNAAKGRIKGAELEATLAPRLSTGNLTITGGASYLDAKYTSFPNGPVAVVPPPASGGTAFVVCAASAANAALCDLSGRTMVKAPKWTFTLRADYSIPIGRNELGFDVSYFHTAKFFWEPEDRLVQPAYDLVNAKVYFAFGNGHRVSVFGFVNNLFDKRYLAYAAPSGLGDNMLPGLPQLYGAGVSVKF